jgi:predicted RNA binding protein YcfA (HicA-like mRNA interferase family)
MSNEKFKKIKDSNEYFCEFLEKLGFQKQAGSGSDVKYKFILEKDNEPII